jgi:undecaprenyl-diphosphatase
MTLSQTMLSYVAAGDHRVMRKVHRWAPPVWLRLWMKYATRAGDGWLWYATGAAILAFGGAERLPAFESAAAAALAGILVFELLKRLTNRRRPCDIEPHCWAELLPPDQFSFPSGHSMTAFAVLVPLAIEYPILLPSLLLCAISIAASRILLGMHFLSDVLAGSALGALIGYASYRWLG